MYKDLIVLPQVPSVDPRGALLHPLTIHHITHSLEGVGGLGEGFEVFPVMLIGLGSVSMWQQTHNWVAYIWQSAVIACGNLGLVGVDEDLGVSGRAAATVTGNHAVVRPRYLLLVDEFNGGIGLWLGNCSVSLYPPMLPSRGPPGLRCFLSSPAGCSRSARTGGPSWPRSVGAGCETKAQSCSEPGELESSLGHRRLGGQSRSSRRGRTRIGEP